MIIPIRCFTCGKVIADKWKQYVKDCEEQDNKTEQSSSKQLHPAFEEDRGGILDNLGITKICCRRHMLGHVDLIEKI